MRKHEPEEELRSVDVMTLSFLDVLSCGLGASMCLFLVFSAMPHVGSQTGAVRSQRAASGGDAMFGSIKRAAAYAVVEMDVRVEQARNCELPANPWHNSFRSARAMCFSSPSLDNGQTRLETAHFESVADLRNPVHFRVAPPRGGMPPGGAIKVKVDLFVGGSRETLPAGDSAATVNAADIDGNSDLIRLDLNKPAGKRLTWGPWYESRRIR